MLRIAIVEDEDSYADTLKEYLHRFEKENGVDMTITRFADGEDITENYAAGFDILLMDIQMRFMDGMTAAEIIRRVDDEVTIIFITNMKQYAIRGYEVRAFDYILKPIEYFSFSHKLGRALERMERKDIHYVMVPVGSGARKLNVDDVTYVESSGHQMVYHLRDGSEVVSRGVMNEREASLSGYGFFRMNKGFIVNMKYVEGVSKGYCQIGGTELSISRKKKQEFMDALTNYLGERVY
ncbi:MAG: response regulator transcription factor [Lachnospiraceae bacterium]|nr:response regulator transcription factor [Lachnospiraceae bacterium]